MPAERGHSMGRKIAGTRELGQVLGLGKTKAAEVAKEPWLVALRGPDGWDEDEILAAKSSREAEAPPELDEDDEAALAGDDPVELARAGVRIAARQLAHRDPAKSTSKVLEDLAEALKALRITEAGYLELAVRRGELLERDVAKACLGAVAHRLVLACQRLEVQIASQVEVWLSDEQLRALSLDERARVLKKWVADQTKGVRLEESGADAWAAVEKLVAAEVAARKS